MKYEEAMSVLVGIDVSPNELIEAEEVVRKELAAALARAEAAEAAHPLALKRIEFENHQAFQFREERDALAEELEEVRAALKDQDQNYLAIRERMAALAAALAGAVEIIKEIRYDPSAAPHIAESYLSQPDPLEGRAAAILAARDEAHLKQNARLMEALSRIQDVASGQLSDPRNIEKYANGLRAISEIAGDALCELTKDWIAARDQRQRREGAVKALRSLLGKFGRGVHWESTDSEVTRVVSREIDRIERGEVEV